MKANMGLVSLIMISVVIGMQLGYVNCFKTIYVGGNLSWHVPDGNDTSFFEHWASSNRFLVGDFLHFEYKNDSVIIVDKYGYYHCNKTNATAAYTDGSTLIKLERPGIIYFISGNDDHCDNGLRLAVDVKSPHSPPPVVPPPSSHGPTAEPPAPTTKPPAPTAEPPAPSADSPAPTANPNSGSQLQVSALIALVATSLFFV